MRFQKSPVVWAWAVGLLIVAVGFATWGTWPAATAWVDGTIAAFRSSASDTHGQHLGEDSHSQHDHHAHRTSHAEASLKLSDQALRNLGLSPDTIRPVRLETFRRSITVPAVVVERPGRTRVQVATPMTGVVVHVHAVQGEAVEPGSLLFQIRLTHEDLVNAQIEFIKTLGELDVEQREINRLQDITQSGAVAGKLLLDREYARDKLTSLLDVQRESLRLHGLSENQVNQIATERRLLRELQIFAPTVDQHDEAELQLTGRFIAQADAEEPPPQAPQTSPRPLILQQLDVHKGQSVAAGQTLCILTDYHELFIEGMAFEQDIHPLRIASEREWTVDAIFQQPGSGTIVVDGLEIAYLANTVDAGSRTLPFYVRLPNEIVKDRRHQGSRYIEWQHLPGQRLQLRVPVEEWPEQIVLPVEAVAREGAESFVFQQNGDHFDRVTVHVKYRDQFWAVIENDGSLFPGDVVALRGAHQLQMALKNQAGGGVDPHAGHNH